MNLYGEYLMESRVMWPEDKRARDSYEHWAMDELASRIVFAKPSDTLEIMYQFSVQMHKYEFMAKTLETQFFFHTAADMADNVLLAFECPLDN